MDRFERRKERSKEDIRRAAEELFTRFGPDKVSINDIARKAGVSQATVYNNFGTKEELVHDYRKTIINAVARRFREILIWKKSWVEKFQGFLQSWIDIADRYHLETAGHGLSDNSGFHDNAGHQTSIDSINKEIENTFLEFIREGKKQERLSADISDEAIMAYINFFQEGISNHPEIQNKMQRDAKISQDLISLFIYGINGKDNTLGQA
jgi:AcrR family transcriptional regulator